MKTPITSRLLRPAFAAVAAIVALGGCSRHDPRASADADLPTVKVLLARAELKSTPSVTEITGNIRPVHRALLSAKVMGAIDDLPVTLGQPVQAGDILARISAAEIGARLLQARSQLNVAQRDLARERDLLGKGASTADLVKGLEDRLAMTQAMVREAEAMLAYTTIRAPFAGVVARKFVNAGDFATPGAPLLEVEGTTAFEVEAGVPDSLAGSLALGCQLLVTVGDGTFDGTLAELAPAADAAAHTVTVKIAVPAQAAVRSGQFARIQIPGASAQALFVPSTAVIAFGQMEQVFVVGADGRAALRLVKTGAHHGDDVEILSGLDDGEQVVVTPPVGLRESQPLASAR